MKIIDGKMLALKVREKLRQEIKQKGLKPRLAVVLVGDNEASQIYVRNKRKAAEDIGLECEVHHLPAESTFEQVADLVKSLNANPKVNGIIVQMPLPQHLNGDKILRLIDERKDVDGFGLHNAGLLMQNQPSAMVAATPKGVLAMLRSTGIQLAGKHAVIIGRSNIVGRPLAALLLNQDCTVTVVHTLTKNIAEITKQADILVAACGCPKLVKASWVKDGAVVIDVGINRIDNHLCGDVDFDEVAPKAAFVSPVPGGVGPMTIAMLLENTVEACEQQMKEAK